MRRLQPEIGLPWLVVTLLLSSGPAIAQACVSCWNESCPSMKSYVARCVVEKKPKRLKHRPAKSASPKSCSEAGEVFVAGHCCFPGQDWGEGSRSCVGTPQCPSGMVVSGKGCVCETGRLVIAGHCCWPGQDWGASAQACVGAPQCPSGMGLQAGSCVPQSVIDEREAAEQARRDAAERERREQEQVVLRFKASDIRESLAGEWRCEKLSNTSDFQSQGTISVSVGDDAHVHIAGRVLCSWHDDYQDVDRRAELYFEPHDYVGEDRSFNDTVQAVVEATGTVRVDDQVFSNRRLELSNQNDGLVVEIEAQSGGVVPGKFVYLVRAR